MERISPHSAVTEPRQDQGMAPAAAAHALRNDSPMIRHLLIGLLLFGAINAFAGGYYGLTGAEGVPREWLRGSPFSDYFIPSLILFAVVGGSFLAAAVFVFARWPHDCSAARAAGAIVLGWLAVQVAIIGYVSWMQPATFAGGLLVLVLAWRLRRLVTAPASEHDLSQTV